MGAQDSEYAWSHECLHKTLIHKTARSDLRLTTFHLLLPSSLLSPHNMPATSDLLSSTSHIEPLKGLLQAVKPYTAILREVVNHRSPSPPSTPSNLQTSIMLSRRVACTHLTMKRKYGRSKCMVCRLVPELGWVYQCTQDQIDEDAYDGEMLTFAGAIHNDSAYASGTQTPKGPAKTKLKPWMEQAVKEGKYTPEQEATLRAQRQVVLDTIAESEGQFESQAKSVPNSLDLVSKGKGEVPPDATPPKMPSMQRSKPRLFPYCIHRACQFCRPTFKDRVWQHLEDVFSDTAPVEVCFDGDPRPLSDPKYVRNLGLRKPPPMHRSPTLKTFGSTEKFSLNDLGQIVRTSTAYERPRENQDSVQSDRPNTQEPDTKGFQKSVKRGFRRMLMSRRNSFYTAPATSTTKLDANSVLPMRPVNDSADFDIGLWRQVNIEVLAEAAATRLPGEDGEDRLEEGGENAEECEETLALTEEAGDLGTADIIVAV